MPSMWINSKPKDDDYDAFVQMHTALLNHQTSNQAKLHFKAQKMWEAFPLAKKKDFTYRMIADGLLEPEIARAVELFGGTIVTHGEVKPRACENT